MAMRSFWREPVLPTLGAIALSLSTTASLVWSMIRRRLRA
jgi:hypothetical protein